MKNFSSPQAALRHHVSGAIARDEAVAITEIPAAPKRQITKWILPAYWASYLVNGDASGLSAEDKVACDAFLAREALSRASFADCSEQYFSRTNDAGTMAGDVCEFTAIHI